jgi:DNA-binding NarL/FixJ family response regulator
MTLAALDPQPVTVLIADDHDLFASSLVELFSWYPDLNVVARVGDGAEAVLLAARLRPDVVVMDVSMPCFDGIVATREITQTLERTRVVVLSALTDAETAFRARSAGAAAYLLKGCPVEDLIATVRAAAGRSQAAAAQSDRLELLERLPAAAAIAH